jgi:hypothetical protein
MADRAALEEQVRVRGNPEQRRRFGRLHCRLRRSLPRHPHHLRQGLVSAFSPPFIFQFFFRLYCGSLRVSGCFGCMQCHVYVWSLRILGRLILEFLPVIFFIRIKEILTLAKFGCVFSCMQVLELKFVFDFLQKIL